MVSDISLFWTSEFEPAGSGQTSDQINPIFRPRLAQRPNIQLRKKFLIISSQLRLFSDLSWVTFIEYLNKKLICSRDLGFYQKRSLPPISVANKQSRGIEIEKMSNLRNLFRMVALSSVNNFIFDTEFDLDAVVIPDSKYNHWMSSIANYQGFPLVLGATNNNKLEMLDSMKSPPKWIEYVGTD